MNGKTLREEIKETIVCNTGASIAMSELERMTTEILKVVRNRVIEKLDAK